MKADVKPLAVDAGSATRTFSNLQWYLAHAKSTVHFARFTRRRLSRDEVKALITRALLRAPDLVRGESVAQDCHHPVGELLPDECLTHETVADLDFDFDTWLRGKEPALTDTGLPAFHAWYLASDKPDKHGNHGVILFMTTHALAEGSDLGQILRGSDVRRPDMLAPAPVPGFGRRFMMRALAPLAAIAHVASAWLERKTFDEFRHVSLVLDAAAVRRTARRLGVKRRTLLFAVVLHSLRPKIARGGRELASWSTLPKQRIAVEVDEYLKLQMQAAMMRGNKDFKSFVLWLDDLITKRDDSGIYTQHFYNYVLSFQRRMNRALPFLYPDSFFGHSADGMVLSLLPPVIPGRDFADLEGGPVFGGSRSNLVSNCVFAPGDKYLTLNLWIDESRAARLPALMERLAEYGLSPMDIR